MKTIPWNPRTLGGEPTELLRLQPPALRGAIPAILQRVLGPAAAPALADRIARLTPEALLRFASWVECYVPDDSEIIAPWDARLESEPGEIRFITEFETYRSETDRTTGLPDGTEVIAGAVVAPGASNLHMRLHVLGAQHVHELYEEELAALFGAAAPEQLALIQALLGFVLVLQPGDTAFERGAIVARAAFLDHNDHIRSEGRSAAHARETLVPLSGLPPL